ncbi:hypothetical protein Q9966_002286 [Columba livia]|nr:hypothetical protein Q9966_002286 [Columba livia]
MTLHAASLERLVEGQATVRIAQREISAMPMTHTWPGHDAARWGPFCCRAVGQAQHISCRLMQSSGPHLSSPLVAEIEVASWLDLLALLHEQGPSTEGIFRLAASERASRDIREALDTGAQVHLASQPVHVLAVILKDFLRKIPSKLLHSELYQQWMDALQKTSRQERLAGLKELKLTAITQIVKAMLVSMKKINTMLKKKP